MGKVVASQVASAVEVLRDPTQAVAASIIEQVAQVTLLRVVLPWMIGRAFDEVGRQVPFAVPVFSSTTFPADKLIEDRKMSA